MDPLTLAAISAGVNVGASLLGELFASGDERAIRRLEEEAMALYGDASPPTLERVLAEKAQSSMEGVQQDPRNTRARDMALQQLMEVGLAGGMDPQSQIALEQGRRAAALHETQGRGAVRQEFQRRGLGGAGEAILQQQAQQAGAHSQALVGLQSAGDARSRALDALATSGGMAEQAVGGDFARAAARAQALDAMSRFNAEQAAAASRFNAGQQQQEFLNDMAVRDRQYGAKRDQIESKRGNAARTRQRVGGVGQALGYGLNAYGQGQPGQQNTLRGPPQSNRGTPEDPWW